MDCYLKQARVFPLEDSSYPEDWSYIVSRFDNPLSVPRFLFNKLISLKNVNNDDAQIISLMEEVDVVLCGLNTVGENINRGVFSKFVSFFKIK